MEYNWYAIGAAIYLIIAVIHFGLLYRMGVKQGQATVRRPAGLGFLAFVSFFWFPTWIVYGVQTLLGRVA